MSRLAAALAASHLTVLDLASNEIMDEGAWELAWRLPECPHLEQLLLAVNEIEDDGAAELLSGLLAHDNVAAELLQEEQEAHASADVEDVTESEESESVVERRQRRAERTSRTADLLATACGERVASMHVLCAPEDREDREIISHHLQGHAI